MLESSQEGR